MTQIKSMNVTNSILTFHYNVTIINQIKIIHSSKWVIPDLSVSWLYLHITLNIHFKCDSVRRLLRFQLNKFHLYVLKKVANT